MHSMQEVIRGDLIPPLINMIKDMNGSNRGLRSITFQQHVLIHNMYVRHRRVVDHSCWGLAPPLSRPVLEFERVHDHLVSTCTRLVQELVAQPNVRVARLLLIPCLYTCGSWQPPSGIARRSMLDEPSRVSAMAGVMRWILEGFRQSLWEAQDLDALDLLRVLVVCGGLVLHALVEMQKRDGTPRVMDKLQELRESHFLEMTFCMMGRLLPEMRDRTPPSSYVPASYTNYQKFFFAVDLSLSLHVACNRSTQRAPGLLCPSLTDLCEQLICVDRRDHPSSEQQINEVTSLLWECRQDVFPSPPFLSPSLTRLVPTSTLDLLLHLPKCVRHARPTTRFRLTRLVCRTARRASTVDRRAAASALVQLVCLFGRHQQQQGLRGNERFNLDEMMALISMAIATLPGTLFVVAPGFIAATEALIRTSGLATPGVELALRLLLQIPCTAETLPASVSIAITARKLLFRARGGVELRHATVIRTLCVDILFALQGRPREIARSGLKLVIIVASILAGACVHAVPEDLDEVVRMMVLLGPMGTLRTALISILVCGHRCPCVHGFLWRAAFPHTLPERGCGSWTCTNTYGHSEQCMRTLLCGGCRRVRYCSGVCQRASWRHGHGFECGMRT